MNIVSGTATQRVYTKSKLISKLHWALVVASNLQAQPKSLLKESFTALSTNSPSCTLFGNKIGLNSNLEGYSNSTYSHNKSYANFKFLGSFLHRRFLVTGHGFKASVPLSCNKCDFTLLKVPFCLYLIGKSAGGSLNLHSEVHWLCI